MGCIGVSNYDGRLLAWRIGWGGRTPDLLFWFCKWFMAICYSSLRTIATSRAICSLRLSMEAKRSSLRSLREKATPSLRP